MDMEHVILVDEQDRELGSMEKMEAHEKGLLHRAFSVFVFNDKQELLLQQRAMSKYHSSGLWTNTCCSHPRAGESTLQAAKRRLREEMGFDTLLVKAFHFIYKAPFNNGLTEHEFDHVFVGTYNGPIHADPAEVMNVEFCSLEEVEDRLKKTPEQFTAWFHIAFPYIRKSWNQEMKKENAV